MTFAATATITASGAATDAYSALEETLYLWAVAGSGLPADRVLWADRGAQPPSGPYLSLRIIDEASVSEDWSRLERVGQSIVHHVRGTRNPTLELTCFAGSPTGGSRAEAVVRRLLTARRLPSVHAILRRGEVGLGTIGKVRVVRGTRGMMFDPRAIVEVMLHTMVDVSEPGQEIKTASGTVLGAPMVSAAPPDAFSPDAFSSAFQIG